MAALEVSIVVAAFPQVVVDVETASHLLPKPCRLVGGVEHQRAVEVHKAVAHDVEGELGAAVCAVAVVGGAQVELAAVQRVERHQILAAVEGFIELQPAPSGSRCGDNTGMVLPAVVTPVAVHGDGGACRETQRVEPRAVRQVEREHRVDEQVVIDVLILGVVARHGQVTVLDMAAQSHGTCNAPVGIDHDGESLALVLSLHLAPVNGNLGIAGRLDVLGHDAAQIGLAVVQRVAPHVAGHAFHHEGTRHETRSDVPSVGVVRVEF